MQSVSQRGVPTVNDVVGKALALALAAGISGAGSWIITYTGWVEPRAESQAAVDQCCPLARECLEHLP